MEEDEKMGENDNTRKHGVNLDLGGMYGDISPTEWIRRAAVFAEQGEQIAVLLFKALGQMAPVLLDRTHPIAGLIAGVGITFQTLRKSAVGQLRAAGVEPLDYLGEQIRLCEEHLKLDLPPEVRTSLEALLAQHREERDARDAEPIDWADPDWAN